MIRIHTLSDSAAVSAMEEGEFPPAVTGSSDRVAIVLTQGWCPDWLMMKSWLTRAERGSQPKDVDVDVYVLIYNKVDYYERFRRFKEEVLGNSLIPYVRFYFMGRYVGDSNQLSRAAFFRRFEPA